LCKSDALFPNDFGEDLFTDEKALTVGTLKTYRITDNATAAIKKENVATRHLLT